MDPNDITAGLTLIALGGFCVSIGYMVKNQSRMLEIQAQLLKCLGDLAGVMAQGASIQAMPMANWRELPPDGQLMMRQSLLQLLAEMDRELPARH